MDLHRLRQEFDAWAHQYDATVAEAEWGFERYDEILDRVVELAAVPPGGRVLDLGTGTGNLAGRFLERGVEVTGVDLSREMLQRAKAKYPTLETVEGHFEDLSRVQGLYDAIVSSYALHHIPDERKARVIRHLQRFLKPGGRIVIADYAFQNVQHRERVRAELLASGREHWWREIEQEYYADLAYLFELLCDYPCEVQREQWTPFVWILTLIPRPSR